MMTPPPASCFALLDDCHATAAQPSSRLYTGFVREHRCDDPAALDALWAGVECDMHAGLHAVVLADYEWGARLMQAGHERLDAQTGGALRVLMFDQLQRLSTDEVDGWLVRHEAEQALQTEAEQALSTEAEQALQVSPGADAAAPAPALTDPAPAGLIDITPSVDRNAFTDAIHRIHALIGEGETYQINYTYRLHFRSFGAPVSLYRRLRMRQPVGFGAFIALPATAGGGYVLSCSPELFLRHTQGKLEARPMKGTASRASAPEGDSEIARLLGEDAKNRAENLMIVDLLRNDLGRVARTGSVRVPKLFAIETYPTVFQMTSTVEAELAPGTPFPDLLRALFPCGSITGAPKHRSMQIIANLETTPRGLYTGSIGWIEPPNVSPEPGSPAPSCGDFCLSVAIRSITLDPPDECGLRTGRMGVGAGIVIDSRADEEFEECQLKARFLTELDPGFSLFETLFARSDRGIRHLDRHLDRLQASARALGFVFRRAPIIDTLVAQCASLSPGHDYRIRLALHKDGNTEVVVARLAALPSGPVALLPPDDSSTGAGGPLPADDPFIRHKTSLRRRYDAAIAAATGQGAFDQLFINRAGQITEGARSNVFALIDGQWITPPVGAGLLPGIMRGVLLDDPAWNAREAPLTLDDLRRADRIVLCNALRGPIDAVLCQPAAQHDRRTSPPDLGQ